MVADICKAIFQISIYIKAFKLNLALFEELPEIVEKI